MASNPQRFLDNSTGIPALWNCVKSYVKKNGAESIRFEVNTQTGHLISYQDGNTKSCLDLDEHSSEVEK